MVTIHRTQPIGVVLGRNTTMLSGAVSPPFALPFLLQKAGQLFTWWMAPRNRRDTAFYALVFTLWTECSNIARTGTGIHLKQSTTYSFTKRNNDVVRSITCWLFTDQTLSTILTLQDLERSRSLWPRGPGGTVHNLKNNKRYCSCGPGGTVHNK